MYTTIKPKSPKLIFAGDNAKLSRLKSKIPQYLRQLGQKPEFAKQIASFSKLSGHSCIYAKQCYSRADEQKDGSLKILDGQHTLFRCFSASQEVLFKNVYKSRKNNTELIGKCQSVSEIMRLIERDLPKTNCVRIFVGGDFSRQMEFDAWLEIAKKYPNRLFYAYTKSLPFWVKRIEEVKKTRNFILTASYGGYKDYLIKQFNLRSVKVVKSIYEARKLKLPIDHDDSHASNPAKKNEDFCLLVHNIQPKNSEYGKAVKRLKGKGSYGRK